MASTVPTEGLDYLINILIKDGESPSSLYLGLFSGGDGTTCPGVDTTRADMGAGFAEATFTSYEAVEVVAADWGAIGDKSVWGDVVRGAVASQKSFPAAVPADPTANITGFFLATAATGGTVVMYSNFNDTTPVASLALGDIVRVTPTFGLGNLG